MEKNCISQLNAEQISPLLLWAHECVWPLCVCLSVCTPKTVQCTFMCLNLFIGIKIYLYLQVAEHEL